MVTIDDDGDDVRSIVTPELRLRFSRRGDRWTHAIDIGPGPWQTLAEAVEWAPAAEGPNPVTSPTYQELHFQQDGADVFALLIGQAGPHHFSASVRVTERVDSSGRTDDPSQRTYRCRADFDVADRCRVEGPAVACNYLIREPPVIGYGPRRQDEPAEEFSRYWPAKSTLWEAHTPGKYYQALLSGSRAPESPTSVAMPARAPSGGWRASVAPGWPPIWVMSGGKLVRSEPPPLPRGGTTRVRYAWFLKRFVTRPAV